ncbi:MAG: hypothetical protein WBC22_16100 [Sedimentisphaerales bacterium]
MRKWAKLTIIITLAIIVTPLACWGLLNLMIWLYHLGPVKGKYYLCAPEELIVKLEGKLDLKFPDDFRDIKAAKTLVSEGSVGFLIRFSAEPNVVDAFFNSFKGEVIFNKYDPSGDVRLNYPKALAWFKKPIPKGKMGFDFNSGRVNSFIYIDITNEKWYVVYWRGSYY